MPTFREYLLFAWVHAAFALQVGWWAASLSAHQVQQRWPEYRCNPLYWIFSNNVEQDFTHCVQLTQNSMMGGYLQPLQYLVTSLTSVGFGTSGVLQDVRGVMSMMRGFLGSLIQNVFGVFFNLVVEFQKMVIAIQDMVGKLIGIVVSLLYVLDGSVQTMNSAWNGPPGQMVQAIGSCFPPDTPIERADGTFVAMESLRPGERLAHGDRVFAVLSVANPKREGVFGLKHENGNGDQDKDRPDVRVTGDHFVRHAGSWTRVRHHPNAVYRPDDVCSRFACLITESHRIRVGPWLFWDWEDDALQRLFPGP